MASHTFPVAADIACIVQTAADAGRLDEGAGHVHATGQSSIEETGQDGNDTQTQGIRQLSPRKGRALQGFVLRCHGSDIVDKSVEDGDIDTQLTTDTIRGKIRDEFIADATVTVVLVGRCTWQRKHVDWEIGSSLRDTKKNSRCGLLGILLPTHLDYGRKTYRPNLLPPKLADNCDDENSFAAIYKWPEPWSTAKIRRWIHAAFERRWEVNPNNARRQFGRNRSGRCGDGWSD